MVEQLNARIAQLEHEIGELLELLARLYDAAVR
jgi:hypothetical protein